MAKTKGERYKCATCGVVVMIEDSCGCETDCLVCCEEPMKKVANKSTKPVPKKESEKASAPKRMVAKK